MDASVILLHGGHFWSNNILYSQDHFASEPVFIPNPNGTNEDDGVVLSTILSNNPKKNPPFLLILDGSTFTEIARAEASYIRTLKMTNNFSKWVQNVFV